MSLGIDPKVDFAFKLVFGSPDHTRITIHFLNAILNLPDPITSVEILNPICGKDFLEDKLVMSFRLRCVAISIRWFLPTTSCFTPWNSPNLNVQNQKSQAAQRLKSGYPF